MNVPVVFISSTVEDLKPYRAAAHTAATSAGFHAIMFEHWTPGSLRRPVDECLRWVSQADLLVVITAHRCGWKPRPPDQPPGEHKSITRLECEHALREGKEVLAFLVEENAEWPDDHRDDYRVTVALRQRKATTGLLGEVQEDCDRLTQFKEWLRGLGTAATFSNLDQFSGKLGIALRDWRERHPEFAEPPVPAGQSDATKYLTSLRDQTGWIDIRGLTVGGGKAHRLPISELYIPLTTASGLTVADETLGIEREGSSGRLARGTTKEDASAADRARVELEDLLTYRRLVIVGDPGAGKTTFLYRIAFELSDRWLKTEGATPGTLIHAPSGAAERGTEAADSFLARLAAALRRPFAGESTGETRGARTGKRGEAVETTRHGEPPFPIMIRIAELSEHIRRRRAQPAYAGPTTEDSPAWLLDFLKDQNVCDKWGLGSEFFERKLESGSAILLLDGLDEPPGTVEREAIARLFEKATRAYERCRFVVTTRPLAYVAKAVLDGFDEARIEPLGPEQIESFLGHWCRALFPESEEKAQRHLRELAEALRSTVEIRRMSSNPVMLTALAVVHWNERRIPEQRTDLYQSILNWLARSRQKRPGREPAERCLTLLECLALGMQDQPQGRLVQVSKGQAADLLMAQFAEEGQAERRRRAQDFIAHEEVDSGIILSRGSDIRFWHLTFQEYLAARAIGGLADRDQDKLLLSGNKIYLQEWREVALLLAGVLKESGASRVDRLVTEVLNRLGERASLAKRARCVGLLGAMVQDLRPLGYEPADARYEEALQSALGIFDKVKSQQVSFQVRLEAAEALGQAGDPRLQQNNWIMIPPGKFLMGAQKGGPSKPNYDAEGFDDESPVREVYLDAYQIGRYPVTVEQFRRFVEDDDGYRSERWWRAGGFEKREEPRGLDEQVPHPNWPVVGASWYEAAAYCAWAGARLPTEAEWERAARGTTGRKFPWGNEEPDSTRANYADGRIGHPTPVGLYPMGATPEGIEDLAGNVWEWVADWYGSYAKSSTMNPRGPESGYVRVVRGGSRGDDPGLLRAAFRGGFEPDVRDVLMGFRCAREVLP